MTYLLLLLAVPLCLFAPITIMFVVDEICLLCKVDDDLRTIIDSAVGIIALVTYFVSPFLGAGYLEADAIHIREKLRNQSIKF